MGPMFFARDEKSDEVTAGAGEVPLKVICYRLQVDHFNSPIILQVGPLNDRVDKNNQCPEKNWTHQ